MDKKYIEYLEKSLDRFNCLKDKIDCVSDFNNQRMIDLFKEYSSLKKPVSLYLSYKDVLKDISSTKLLLAESDVEIKMLAVDELEVLAKKRIEYEAHIKKTLFVNKPSGVNNIFLEIRSATGGDESAIFVEDLLKMYILFLNNLNFKHSFMSFSLGNIGGYKEVILRISGSNVFDKFKYESGIHRVQRVPKTDAHGRIHTSTCTVAMLPEIKAIDSVDLDTGDLRIDTYRASGAGGQHVNMTDSAVRITHIPTSIVAECQSERSQHKNKQKALSLLMSRLLIRERALQKENLDSSRKKMVGTGSRSEKIRTYNYIGNRITDHRINVTLYKLLDIMSGRLDLIVDKFDDSSL